MRSSLHWCCLAVWLVGCAQAPEAHRDPAPIPQTWSGTEPGRGVVIAPTGLHWRDFFTDPALRTLIDTALQNNRDVQWAAARVLEAKAQYGAARADRFPSINALFGINNTGVPGDLNGTGTDSVSRRTDASLSISGFELDLWGRLGALDDAAKKNLLAAHDAKRTVQLSLVAEVASSYYVLLQAQELVALGQELVQSRQQTLELVEKGRDIGGTYRLEVEQAASALESSRATLDGLHHQQRLALNRLAYLVGYAVVPSAAERPLPPADEVPPVQAGVPSTVLLSRPDVMAAERRLQAASANVQAARAAFLPRLLLTTSLGLASQGLSTLLGSRAWAFQPVLTTPLFDGGRQEASLDLAQARKHAAVAEYERTIQTAFREVADLLSSRQSLLSQRHAAAAQLRAQRVRLEIAQARFEGGVSSYLEVLDARREWLGGREMDIQLRRAQLDVNVQMFKALGGQASV
ncbi:MAG: efflux transporter outer membrane subunit [Rhodoferax sp.]